MRGPALEHRLVRRDRHVVEVVVHPHRVVAQLLGQHAPPAPPWPTWPAGRRCRPAPSSIPAGRTRRRSWRDPSSRHRSPPTVRAPSRGPGQPRSRSPRSHRERASRRVGVRGHAAVRSWAGAHAITSRRRPRRLGVLAMALLSPPRRPPPRAPAPTPATGAPPAPRHRRPTPVGTAPGGDRPPATIAWTSLRRDAAVRHPDRAPRLVPPRRHRSTSPSSAARPRGHRIGSLFVNPGGPGGSGIDSWSPTAFGPREGLNRRFDIVSWDPRGVGRSTAVTCGDSAGAVPGRSTRPRHGRRAAGARRRPPRPSPTTARPRGGRCSTTWAPSSRPRPRGHLRQALGDRAHLRGLLVRHLHRPAVRRALPRPGPGHGARRCRRPRARTSSSSWPARPPPSTAVLATVAGRLRRRTSSCPVADPAATYDRVRPRRSRPHRCGPSGYGSVGRRATLATAPSWPLRPEPGGPRAHRRWPSARAGDGTGLSELATSTTTPCPATAPTPRSPAPTSPHPQGSQAYAGHGRPARGPVTPLRRIGGQRDAPVRLWPAPTTGTRYQPSDPGAPPILVIGNTGDSATPYAQAEAVAGWLSDAVLVTYDGRGHTAGGRSSCVDDSSVATWSTSRSPPRARCARAPRFRPVPTRPPRIGIRRGAPSWVSSTRSVCPTGTPARSCPSAHQGKPMEFNLADVNEAVAAAVPDREAIAWGDRRITYAQLAERTRRLANHLLDEGFEVPGRARPSSLGHQSGPGPPGPLPAQRQRVPRGHARRLQGPGGAVQRQLPLRGRGAPLPAGRLRGPRRRLPLDVRPDPRRGPRRPAQPRHAAPGARRLGPRPAATARSGTRTPWPPPRPSHRRAPTACTRRPTTSTSSTPAAPPACPRACCGARPTSSWPPSAGATSPPATSGPTSRRWLENARNGGARLMPAPPFMHGAAHWIAFNALNGGNTVVIPRQPRAPRPGRRLRPSRPTSSVNILLIVGDAFGRPLADELDRHDYDLSSLLAARQRGRRPQRPAQAAAPRAAAQRSS